MTTIAKNLNGLNATRLVDKSQFVEARIQDNPAFPTPNPTLVELATARAALQVAIIGAMDGGRTAVAIRRGREQDLRLLLNQLAGYVSSLAEGNALAILSSGFDVKRVPSPAGELRAPADLQASISPFVGRVDLRWKPVKHAVAYQVHLNRRDPVDEAAWQLAGVSTKAVFNVTGLATATLTWFRVNAIGTSGTGPLSEVAHSLAK
ncbi:MAG: hypothetical protein ACOH13_00565 [Flavobacteriales bacterium]